MPVGGQMVAVFLHGLAVTIVGVAGITVFVLLGMPKLLAALEADYVEDEALAAELFGCGEED